MPLVMRAEPGEGLHVGHVGRGQQRQREGTIQGGCKPWMHTGGCRREDAGHKSTTRPIAVDPPTTGAPPYTLTVAPPGQRSGLAFGRSHLGSPHRRRHRQTHGRCPSPPRYPCHRYPCRHQCPFRQRPCHRRLCHRRPCRRHHSCYHRPSLAVEGRQVAPLVAAKWSRRRPSRPKTRRSLHQSESEPRRRTESRPLRMKETARP